jgi:hypothetical protein
MEQYLTWVWLAAGLVPYQIEKKLPSRRERILIIRALFWSLEVRTRRIRRTKRTDWILHIPLIDRVRDAVWAAATRLKSSDPQEPQP